MARKANRKKGKQSGHKSRKDEKSDKRMLTAAFLFGLATLGLVSTGTWTALSSGGQDGKASAAQSLAIFILMFCVFASVVNIFVAYGKVCWFYRCPSCGTRLTRIKPDVLQYPCDSCGVLWDTGWAPGD